ncbi:helix-turn-helix transcriptional regulator [Escherichia coli]|uniref:Putative ARAC-type regulatory protein n=1 Tax=Escherichia coli TA447 TaxID=656447 RepID=A0A1X3IT81_ECOLX|nr:helix-turn-helix transcriptional regulator [Escherichia coli]OSK88082.1 putative ARAC-type regulatory protein [Escherichia coli TA447]
MNKEKIVLHIIERIEARIQKKENISVNEVAVIAGYTKRYTQKIFKEQTGMNISTYIRRRRLTQAAILIKMTKKTLYHIAMDLHFSTQQSFSRAFSREFDITPIDFRNGSYLDCSKLLPNRAIKLTNYHIQKTHIPALKLSVKSFCFYERLLSIKATRASKLRISEINNIISNKKEVIIITTVIPNSKIEDVVQLHTRIGYKDNETFNFETDIMQCWEITYSGGWDEYIKFGRSFMLELDFCSPLYFIEMIKKSEIDSSDDIYHVKIYLPVA